MNINHELTSFIQLGRGTIRFDEVITHRGGADADLVTHYQTVIDTKDAMMHDALVALGWTPPAAGRLNDHRVLHSKREMAAEVVTPGA